MYIYNTCIYRFRSTSTFLHVCFCFTFTYAYTPFGNLQVQVARTQWLLVVELHQFDNRYNAKVSNDNEFCCCEVDSCTAEAADLPYCEGTCQTWFEASVSHCIAPNPCSFITLTYVNILDVSVYNLRDTFVFVLTSFPDMVSVNKL